MPYCSRLDSKAGIGIFFNVESETIGSTFRAGGEIPEIGEGFSGYLSAIRIFAKFLDIFRCFPHLVSTANLILLLLDW
jgi:hypothetical protein